MTAAGEISLCYQGERKTLKRWAKERGVSYYTLYGRYRQGWTAEEILETPVRFSRLAPKVPELPIERDAPSEEEEPWMLLLVAIVNRARLDYKRPAYRTDVETFFRRGVLMRVLDIDGEYILEQLVAAEKG